MGCRRRAPQDQLERIVAVAGRPGPGRGLPGRGAWLCRGSASCLDSALRKGGLARALRLPITPEAGRTLEAELRRLEQAPVAVWEDVRPRPGGVDTNIGKD